MINAGQTLALMSLAMMSLPMLCASAAKEIPVWSIKLTGISESRKVNADVAHRGGSNLIAFGSSDEIVVLAHQPVGNGKAEQRVKAVALDAGSGKVRGSREWTTYGGSAVFATVDGEYACTDPGTVLYSKNLDAVLARSDKAVRFASPGGERLAAVYRPNKSEVWVSLDAHTLADEIVLNNVSHPSISKEAVVELKLRRNEAPAVQIESRGSDPVRYRPRWGVGEPYFVSNTVILVMGEGNYDAISTQGNLLFAGSTRDEEPFIASSRDGRRMAMLERIYRGDQEELVEERVRVIELKDGKTIWSLKVKALRGEYESVSQVALSPDGLAIAVLSLEQVSMFRLP